MSEIEFRFNKIRSIGIINGYYIKSLVAKGYIYSIRQNKDAIEVSFSLNEEFVSALKYEFRNDHLFLLLKETYLQTGSEPLMETLRLENIVFTESIENGIIKISIDCTNQAKSAFINSIKHVVNCC